MQMPFETFDLNKMRSFDWAKTYDAAAAFAVEAFVSTPPGPAETRIPLVAPAARRVPGVENHNADSTDATSRRRKVRVQSRRGVGVEWVVITVASLTTERTDAHSVTTRTHPTLPLRRLHSNGHGPSRRTSRAR